MKEVNNILPSEKPEKITYTKRYFKEHSVELLQKAMAEHGNEPGYHGKDFKGVMQEFLEGIEMKNYKYQNHYLAYLKWVRMSKRFVSAPTISNPVVDKKEKEKRDIMNRIDHHRNSYLNARFGVGKWTMKQVMFNPQIVREIREDLRVQNPELAVRAEEFLDGA